MTHHTDALAGLQANEREEHADTWTQGKAERGLMRSGAWAWGPWLRLRALHYRHTGRCGAGGRSTTPYSALTSGGGQHDRLGDEL